MERLLAQNHLANKWQNQDLNTGNLATQSVHLTLPSSVSTEGSGQDKDRERTSDGDRERDFKFLTLATSGEWNWAQRWLEDEECDKLKMKSK